MKGIFRPACEIYTMKKAIPRELIIFVPVDPRKSLVDMRVGRRYSKFGNIMDVARQHGVKATQHPNGIEFRAPKNRMQMFAEKLHFSQIPYQEIIF